MVFANERLVALLVPAREGWFLQVGLGPCEREGLLFGNLGGAEAWVRACLATCPAEQERRAEPLV
ncbi:hypothetical protein [Methylobacterium nigriterrae]|uniref:hypothetical protein n=1 Tax=Methylobacterium nigriterrae TaxID=3127512 RepID=UPI00301419D4